MRRKFVAVVAVLGSCFSKKTAALILSFCNSLPNNPQILALALY